jgi:putative DNA-invertase from lambdoid prophage Rac
MRIALYARVSTTDQSCEMQLRELRDYTASRGWQVLTEYVDTGWSGARASRPQLDRLLQDARARRFDAVLVWKLDRWGRSVADSIRSIQELVSLGVRFLAVTQNLDTDETNPMSRFLLHILAAFSELEREMIRERVRPAYEPRRPKERPWGAPGGPSGATRQYGCAPRARHQGRGCFGPMIAGTRPGGSVPSGGVGENGEHGRRARTS